MCWGIWYVKATILQALQNKSRKTKMFSASGPAAVCHTGFNRWPYKGLMTCMCAIGLECWTSLSFSNEKYCPWNGRLGPQNWKRKFQPKIISKSFIERTNPINCQNWFQSNNPHSKRLRYKNSIIWSFDLPSSIWKRALYYPNHPTPCTSDSTNRNRALCLRVQLNRTAEPSNWKWNRWLKFPKLVNDGVDIPSHVPQFHMIIIRSGNE